MLLLDVRGGLVAALRDAEAGRGEEGRGHGRGGRGAARVEAEEETRALWGEMEEERLAAASAASKAMAMMWRL